MMQISACSGSRYLVRVDEQYARVLSLNEGILYPPALLGSIWAHTHGYWDAYDGTAEELNELLTRVRSFETWDAYFGRR